MAQWKSDEELFAWIRNELSTPPISDVMEQLGFRYPMLPAHIRPLRSDMVLIRQIADPRTRGGRGEVHSLLCLAGKRDDGAWRANLAHPRRSGRLGPLGTMGEAMALTLVKAGTRLLVWNRTRSKAETLAAAGADVAREAADVFAHSATVFLMLVDGGPNQSMPDYESANSISI
jgi:NAD binding domain of 6-phosphogluconate dehydrogenase